MSNRCSAELLELALAGNLPVDREELLHHHLEECKACSAAIEQMAGGATWCREAAALLIRDELDDAVPSRDEWSNVDFTVEHLEPSDEPNVLGKLGGYDVLEIIGRGGMGVVLKGFDRELKRRVAIKVLSPHLAQSSLAKKRFAREAQAAAAVVHPNVLAIHQVQPGGQLPFLVMPLVAGESLAGRLIAQGRLELKETLRIGMQAAAGLAAAHEQGLVHRDVKPANILLEKGVERAVLTDFGLARAADDVSMTRWGIIAGTPQYMSPEQAQGEPLDGRSDLFSLGCVLYEMATGVSPFRADSTMATLRRLIDDAPPTMASLNPELPPWFIGIVDRLLEKDPSRRFGSAKEVSELMEGCLAHLQQPTSVPLPAAIPAPAARPVSRLRKHYLKGTIIMLATLGMALSGMFVMQAAEPPDIAGRWSSERAGQIVLKQTAVGEYEGTYGTTGGKRPGKIQVSWSRLQRRFNGTWREGDDCFGELSLRLADKEIRGARTTDPKSKVDPATPRLADFVWKRVEATAEGNEAAPAKSTAAPLKFAHRVSIGKIASKIACSPDGKLIAIANGGPTLILRTDGTSRVKDNWKPSVDILDGETGKIVASLELVSNEENAVLTATKRVSHFQVGSLAFSPDGNMLAVGTSIGQVKLFNSRTGELVKSLDDEKAKLAGKDTPENWKSLRRAMGGVGPLAFSPDGSLLATCGISFADFDSAGRLGFRGTGPGRLKLWDVQSGRLKHDLAGHDDHVNAVAFSSDGRLLASAGRWMTWNESGTGVIVWNSQTGEKICRLPLLGANGGAHAVAFSPDSRIEIPTRAYSACSRSSRAS
ncbi:MAG: WD40 repeat domain-containing serine/threonine protein kinase [Planctomycetota bacterium]|jgi:serine/threonine-protein kinase